MSGICCPTRQHEPRHLKHLPRPDLPFFDYEVDHVVGTYPQVYVSIDVLVLAESALQAGGSGGTTTWMK